MRYVVAFFDLFLKHRKHIFLFSWLQKILFQLIRLCEWREYRWNLGNRIGFNTGVDTTKRISVCLLDLPNLVVKYYIEVPLILLLLLLQRCVEQGVSKYLFKNKSFNKIVKLIKYCLKQFKSVRLKYLRLHFKIIWSTWNDVKKMYLGIE